MRVSTSQMHETSLTAMLDQQVRLNKTMLQLTTGRRILTPSDDPPGSVQVLNINQEIELTKQYQKNANIARTALVQEEDTLVGVINVLQRARELAVRGNNDALGPDSRKGIALEVRELLDTLMGLANTTDTNGNHIFAGYQSAATPFEYDAVNQEYVYNGDQGQRLLQIGPERRIADGDPGSDVFMRIPGSGNNMFEILDTLASSLEANTPDIATLGDLDAALTHVTEIRARIGSRINAIDGQEEVNDAYMMDLEITRSDIADLDYAKAISSFNQQMIALQAAQRTYVQVQGLTLFDYLR